MTTPTTEPPRREGYVGLVLVELALLVTAFTYLNALPLVQRLPARPSMFGTAVLVGAILIRLVGKAPTPRGWDLVALLWISFLLAFPSRPWSTYTHDKVLAIFTATLLCAVGAMFVLRTPRARSVWLWLVVGMGLAAAGAALLLPDATAEAGGRLAIEGGSAISAGRGAGAAVVVLVALALGRARRRGLLVLVAVGLSLVMVQTGSRGPLLAALIAVLLVALVPSRGRFTRLLLAAATIGLSVYAVASGNFDTERLADLGTSGDNRLQFWHTTWDVIVHHPFGVGWGGMETLLPPGRDYPHNLLLEVFAEGGWIVGALVLVVLVVAWRRQRAAAAGNPVEMAMLGMFAFALVNAMVSSDISGNRGVWVSLAAGLLMARTSSAEDADLPRSRSRVNGASGGVRHPHPDVVR